MLFTKKVRLPELELFDELSPDGDSKSGNFIWLQLILGQKTLLFRTHTAFYAKSKYSLLYIHVSIFETLLNKVSYMFSASYGICMCLFKHPLIWQVTCLLLESQLQIWFSLHIFHLCSSFEIFHTEIEQNIGICMQRFEIYQISWSMNFYHFTYLVLPSYEFYFLTVRDI